MRASSNSTNTTKNIPNIYNIITRIFPQVIVQTKKDTLLGALVHQTLFLGKELVGAPPIASCKKRTEKMPLFFSFHSILSLPSNKKMSGWYGLV